MLLDRRCLLFGAATGAATLTLPKNAFASTARGVTLPQLQSRSTEICVAEAISKHSRWVRIRGAERIATFSRVLLRSPLQGTSKEEFTIVTLGGVVGKVGQKVPGEAHLPLGQEALLFACPCGPSEHRITAMSQGLYPIKDGKLEACSSLPHLIGERPGRSASLQQRWAIDVLAGRSLGDAMELLLEP